MILWADRNLKRETTPEGLVHFDQQVARLTRLRGASPARPGLVLLTYRVPEPQVATRLRRIGATSAPLPPEAEENFIPGDGHPTATGNLRFAAAVATAIESDSLSTRLIAAAVP